MRKPKDYPEQHFFPGYYSNFRSIFLAYDQTYFQGWRIFSDK